MAPQFEIKTERFLLRAPALGDAGRVTAQISERDVMWNLGRAPLPYHKSDAEVWIKKCENDRAKGSEYAFVITNIEDGVIGAVGFNRAIGDVWELGYWIGKSWWGKGVATEVSRALLEWADTEFGITTFVAGHFKDNPASGRVLEKLGFEPVGEKLMFGRARGGKHPAIRYALGASADAALRSAAH